MKTIEERAKENNNGSLPNDFSYRDGYFDGAREQHKIDIDKACLEFMRLIQGLCQNRDHEDALYFKFRKAMEECVLNTTD